MSPHKSSISAQRCMELVFEYLSGINWSDRRSAEGLHPKEFLRSTCLTRPQRLVLLCYLQIIGKRFPGLSRNAEICIDILGFEMDEVGACQSWADTIVGNLSKCSLEDLFRRPPLGLQREMIRWVGRQKTARNSGPKGLKGLRGDEFRYPGESGLLNTLLDLVPGLRGQLSLVSKASAGAVSTIELVQFRLNAIEVTRRTIPQIARSWERACRALSIAEEVPLYLSPRKGAVGVLGIASPVVVLPTSIASTFEEDELVFLLGRELGKLLCEHQQLLGLVETIQGGADQLGVGIIAKLASNLAFDKWRRAAQLTCDRAGLLACQTPEVVERVFFKWMGYPLRYARRIPAWTLREIVAERAGFCEQTSFASIADQAIGWAGTVTGPSWPLLTRMATLYQWMDCGEFNDVITRKSGSTAGEQLNEIFKPKRRRHHVDEMVLESLRKSRVK